jgi:hypothetical protein
MLQELQIQQIKLGMLLAIITSKTYPSLKDKNKGQQISSIKVSTLCTAAVEQEQGGVYLLATDPSLGYTKGCRPCYNTSTETYFTFGYT